MPISIQGREYFTVAERLTMARGDTEAPRGIQRIETTMEEHGGVVVILARVTFESGQVFTGMSMVKGDSRSPAERDAPVETCETSALGRALAFAGYHGSPEGIAGAEELHLAQQRAEARAKGQAQGVITPPPTTFFPDGSSGVTRGTSGLAPRPVGNPGGPSPAQVRFASKLWGDAGRPMPPPDFEKMKSVEVSALIDELKAAAPR